MRMRRSRIKEYALRNRIEKKGAEGNTFVSYAAADTFPGENWPGGGEVQAKTYGTELTYIHNIRVLGVNYIITTDYSNVVHYVYPSGLDISENDGVCLFVPETAEPDYRIVAIKPYKQLQLEVKRL